VRAASCRVRQKYIDFCRLRVEAASSALCRFQVPETGTHTFRGHEKCATNESEAQMSERLETLKKARERMTEDRDAFAKTLAAPFDRDKAERARAKFIETQLLIDAIDRAIAGEQNA
jgi:hypothetical protein